jgi:uncharacterized protein (TIRG00374 family)
MEQRREQKRERRSRFQTFAIYPILIPLLYFALRNAPLTAIWNAVSQLTFWQIAVLAVINMSVYLLITLRWWIILRATHKTISYLPLVLIRIAVFGISYFTLGPQIGGEPLQVLYLQRKYQMTYTRATSTVIMDKLLEFLANFFLLVTGLTAILQVGILSTNARQPLVSLVPMAAILLWPFLHIALMVRGILPARKSKVDAVYHCLRTHGRYVLQTKPACLMDGNWCIAPSRRRNDHRIFAHHFLFRNPFA